MIELPAPRNTTRHWFVCEAGRRWLPAVARFAPPMMPPPLTLAIHAADPARARRELAGQRSAVVLWEVRRDSFTAACDQLAAVAIHWPRVLQLVAVTGLTDREQLVLSEFRAAAAIQHPEHLPRLAVMIQGYFARSVQDLD